MQVTSKLDDGSAVVLTVAEYKTVKSECYDKIGITPDYIVESDDENSNTDLQLNKAIEVIKKWNENQMCILTFEVKYTIIKCNIANLYQ